MKKFLFVFILFLGACSLSAQDSTQMKKLSTKKESLDQKFAKFSKDRIAINLLAANWIYNPDGQGMNGMRTRWFSRGLDIYFYWDFRFKHSRISFAPGIGYSVYTINERSQLTEDSSGVHFEPLNDPNNYKVNSITLQYLDIPMELRIRSNPDKFDNMWKVSIGFKAGVRLDVHTKQTILDVTTSPLAGTNNTEKVQDLHRFPDFSPFRFGPTLRVGYSVFNVVAFYDVLGVFKSGRGPSAHDFSVGLSFNGL